MDVTFQEKNWFEKAKWVEVLGGVLKSHREFFFFLIF